MDEGECYAVISKGSRTTGFEQLAEIATPEADGQPSDRYELRGFTVIRPTEEDIEAIPSIWAAYNLFGTDLLQPGLKTFELEMSTDQPLLWPWSWCAAEGRLRDNLEDLDVHFLIEDVHIPNELLLEYETHNEGVDCHFWTVKIPWFVLEQSRIRVNYTMRSEINDGMKSYPAGDYNLEIFIHTTYEKQLFSEIYGFSFTFPLDTELWAYDATAEESVASLTLPYRRTSDDGDILPYIDVWVEDGSDTCHHSLTDTDLDIPVDLDVPVKEEQVWRNGIPFTRVYTPDPYTNRGTFEQNIEYMTMGDDFCVHFTVLIITYYFNLPLWRDVNNPPNVLPIVLGDIEAAVSTFRWTDS